MGATTVVTHVSMTRDALGRRIVGRRCRSLADSCFRFVYVRRQGFAVCSGLRARSAQKLQLLRDRPDEAKQFACDRGHRDLAFFTAPRACDSVHTSEPVPSTQSLSDSPELSPFCAAFGY